MNIGQIDNLIRVHSIHRGDTMKPIMAFLAERGRSVSIVPYSSSKHSKLSAKYSLEIAYRSANSFTRLRLDDWVEGAGDLFRKVEKIVIKSGASEKDVNELLKGLHNGSLDLQAFNRPMIEIIPRKVRIPQPAAADVPVAAVVKPTNATSDFTAGRRNLTNTLGIRCAAYKAPSEFPPPAKVEKPVVAAPAQVRQSISESDNPFRKKYLKISNEFYRGDIAYVRLPIFLAEVREVLAELQRGAGAGRDFFWGLNTFAIYELRQIEDRLVKRIQDAAPPAKTGLVSIEIEVGEPINAENLMAEGKKIKRGFARGNVTPERRAEAEQWIPQAKAAIDEYLERISRGWAQDMIPQRPVYLTLAEYINKLQRALGIEVEKIDIPHPQGRRYYGSF